MEERDYEESEPERLRIIKADDYGTEDFNRGSNKRPRIGLFVTIAFLSALVGGISASLLVPYIYGSSPSEVFSSDKGPSVIRQKEIINVDGGKVSPVTAVAKKLQPSIVNIKVREPIGDIPHPDVVSSGGAGVIFKPDGYIITNSHVVSGAKDIFITIGTEEIKGKLVAEDKDVDMAVVKVDRQHLPAAEFGSTKKLQVGELAVAIGSPFGFEHTVTSGIISALNRTISIPDEGLKDVKTYTNLIQTDAPINPGNSGGALSDSKGRVIGINTFIMSRSGSTEGVGFAIPVETAVNVAKQLIAKGKASHPYIGILGQSIDSSMAGVGKMGVDKGAIIVDVVKGSPADKAGLKEKDVILAVDGKNIESMDELIAVIRQKKVGDSLVIKFLRSGKQALAKIVLAEKPKK